ncbi:hypothetical protein EJB05_56656, partial [Eragrostis curvula]
LWRRPTLRRRPSSRPHAVPVLRRRRIPTPSFAALPAPVAAPPSATDVSHPGTASQPFAATHICSAAGALPNPDGASPSPSPSSAALPSPVAASPSSPAAALPDLPQCSAADPGTVPVLDGAACSHRLWGPPALVLRPGGLPLAMVCSGTRGFSVMDLARRRDPWRHSRRRGVNRYQSTALVWDCKASYVLVGMSFHDLLHGVSASNVTPGCSIGTPMKKVPFELEQVDGVFTQPAVEIGLTPFQMPVAVKCKGCEAERMKGQDQNKRGTFQAYMVAENVPN